MKIRSFGEKRPGGQWNGVGDGGSNADAREGESVLCRERETGEGESLERGTCAMGLMVGASPGCIVVCPG
jgi:hypothetical protein